MASLALSPPWTPVLLLTLGGFACAFPRGGAALGGCDPDAAVLPGAPGLAVSARQGTRSIPLGRQCATIPARGHALTRDDAPAEGTAVRVRNLTVANLVAQPPARGRSAATASPPPAAPARQQVQGPAAPDPGPAGGSAASTSAGVSGTPVDSRARGTEAESAGVVVVPVAQASRDSAEVAGPPVAVQGSRTPADASAPGTGQATAARVIRGILRGVVLLSAVALTVAGIGILLPVLAALYAVALGVGLIVRRVLRRREAGAADGSAR